MSLYLYIIIIIIDYVRFPYNNPENAGFIEA